MLIELAFPKARPSPLFSHSAELLHAFIPLLGSGLKCLSCSETGHQQRGTLCLRMSCILGTAVSEMETQTCCLLPYSNEISGDVVYEAKH